MSEWKGKIKKGEKRALGNKGGGRKSFNEEYANWKETIKAEALVELANKMVHNQMKKGKSNLFITKEFALPISLKGMSEKIALTGKDGEDLKINITIDDRARIAKTIGGIIKSTRRQEEQDNSL